MTTGCTTTFTCSNYRPDPPVSQTDYPRRPTQRLLVSTSFTKMDCEGPFPPADASDVFATLHQGSANLRSYQPYCVTEASSRPQSPDVLAPIPLFIVDSRKRAVKTNAQDLAPLQVNANTVPIPTTTTTKTTTPPRIHHQGMVVETGSRSEIRCRATNRKMLARITESVDSHHMARAVTPRGSHLLASVNKRLCDGSLSPQIQQTEGYNLSAWRLLQCNSLGPSSCREVEEEKSPLFPTL